ncbi:MAG: hypothetical protein AAF330_07760 [Pseudomonadota bacterium]
MGRKQLSLAHRIYLELRAAYHPNAAVSAISKTEATRILSNLLAPPGLGFCVVGITPAALDAFHTRDERQRGQWWRARVHRAHLWDRAETVVCVLAGPKLDANTLLREWRKRDICILALSSENKSISTKKFYPFPDREKQFFPNASVGYRLKIDPEAALLWDMQETKPPHLIPVADFKAQHADAS